MTPDEATLRKWAELPDFDPKALMRARYESKITQCDLAEQLGVSESTIRYWEKGKKEPAPQHHEQLIETLPGYRARVS